MQIIRTIPDMKKKSEQLRQSGKKIGFVPTMGFLHEGHLSLLDIARKNSDVSIMSIFVNPTQFAPNEDFDEYPRDFERDERLARQRGCDIIFYPDTNKMYPDPYRTYVNVEEITTGLCGRSRPTFFRGVTTIVTKLLNIVQPHVAVFGQKDAQQSIIIKQMIRDLNMDIRILVGPIIREEDGLALSSRNKYLSANERKDALVLNQSLQKAREMIDAGVRDPSEIKTEMEQIIHSAATAKIDYVELVDSTNLEAADSIKNEILIAVAVWIGDTRLIDNIIISA